LDLGLVERAELFVQAQARTGAELALELLNLSGELGDGSVVENVRLAQRVECLRVASEVVKELALEAENILNRDLVHVALGASPDRNGLLLDGVRRVLA